MTQSEALFWATNAFVAKRFMKALPKKSVELCAYNGGENADSNPTFAPKVDDNGHGCGGIACLGGWVAVMPYFVRLGVTRDPSDGSPELGGITSASTVATILFGDAQTFSARLGTDNANESDRKIALRRLKVVLDMVKTNYPRVYEAAKEASKARPKVKRASWPVWE